MLNVTELDGVELEAALLELLVDQEEGFHKTGGRSCGPCQGLAHGLDRGAEDRGEAGRSIGDPLGALEAVAD